MAGVAGAPVDVTHVDGGTVHTTFPALVDPVQPITNIRALKHQVMPGVFATCTMEGETWETEDHRNWTDANFKTHSRLLDDPWPYTIAKGETIGQSVSLTFDGTLPAAADPTPPAPVRIDIAADPDGTAPRIGIGVSAQYAEAALDALDYLERVAPDVLICEYAPCLGDPAAVLTHHRALAAALGAETVLHAVLANEADAATEARSIAADAAAAGFKPDAVVLTPRPHLMSRSIRAFHDRRCQASRSWRRPRARRSPALPSAAACIPSSPSSIARVHRPACSITSPTRPATSLTRPTVAR